FAAWQGLSDTYRAAIEQRIPWRPSDAEAAPLTIPDIAESAALADDRELMAAEQVRALAFIPLRFDGRVLGEFVLHYREPHTFTEDEIAAAELIAGQVAFA